MPFIDSTAKLYYEDAGAGQPVVLIHGWPLTGQMWEYQLPTLVDAGYRCITYDRRGFGQSERPWDGYDYDTLAADLDALMTQLDLRDAVLVGFSMGGGEVARYLATYGHDRVSKAVLMSAVTPSLSKSDANPDGVPEAVLDEFMEGLLNDRIQFLEEFGHAFFGVANTVLGVEVKKGQDVSGPLLEHYRDLAAGASPRATRECALAFGGTDFSADLAKIDVPTMVIHGDADKTVPFEATGKRAAAMIAGSRLEVLDGAPHGLWYTHRQQVNDLLVDFLRR